MYHLLLRMTDLTFSACQGHPLSFINGKFFNLLSVCQNPGGRRRAKYMYANGPDSLGATGSIYTEHPQKVRSSQRVTKQVDRKSSMDRTGRVGSPGVTEDYLPTISKKTCEMNRPRRGDCDRVLVFFLAPHTRGIMTFQRCKNIGKLSRH